MFNLPSPLICSSYYCFSKGASGWKWEPSEFSSEVACYGIIACVYFPQQQPCLPAADRTESLLDHRGGAANAADAQVDSIVGKFLLWLPRGSSVELGIVNVSGNESSRGKLTLYIDKGRKREPRDGCQKKEGE